MASSTLYVVLKLDAPSEDLLTRLETISDGIAELQEDMPWRDLSSEVEALNFLIEHLHIYATTGEKLSRNPDPL